MSALRGFAVTAVGRNLLARLAATSKPLELTRVLFGTGRMPEGSTNMDLLARTALVEPFAEGSSTTPIYETDVRDTEIPAVWHKCCGTGDRHGL